MQLNTVDQVQQPDTVQTTGGVVQTDESQSGAQVLFAVLLATLTENVAPADVVETASGDVGHMQGETSGETVAIPVVGDASTEAGESAVPLSTQIEHAADGIASIQDVTSAPNAETVPVSAGVYNGSGERSGTSPPVIGLVPNSSNVARENTETIVAIGGRSGEPAGNMPLGSEAVDAGAKIVGNVPAGSSAPGVVIAGTEGSQDTVPSSSAAYQPQGQSNIVSKMAAALSEVENDMGRTRSRVPRAGPRRATPAPLQPAVSGKPSSQPENEPLADIKVRVMPETAGRHAPDTPALRRAVIALQESVPDSAVKSGVVEQTRRETVPAGPSVVNSLHAAEADESQDASPAPDKKATMLAPDKKAMPATVTGKFRARLGEAAARDAAGGDTDLGKAGLLAKPGIRPATTRPGLSSMPDQPPSTRPSQIVDRIVATVRTLKAGDRTEMRVRLKPPHLGELQVRVAHEGDALRVQIAADNGLARDLIDARLPELRNALTEIRGTVSDLNVTVASGEDATSTSLTTGGDGRTWHHRQSGRAQESHQQQAGPENEGKETEFHRRGNMGTVSDGHIDMHA